MRLILLTVFVSVFMASGVTLADEKTQNLIHRLDGTSLSTAEVDVKIQQLMKLGNVPGLALAVVQDGRLVYVKAYGFRSVEKQLPLETNTVLYGASLTKMAFAYMVMQLSDEKALDLDASIATYLKKPLPDYEKYADLATDARWKKLTPRILMSHSTGFPNYRFLNSNGKLDFKFEPGSQYGYSGEGINLLQFILEEGLGLDVGKEMQKRVFDRFRMKNTSMIWQDGFAKNMANGYDVNGKMEGHRARRNVRAAGSMDTTIQDMGQFLAGFLNGEGISIASRGEMLRKQIAITSSHQFPTIEAASLWPHKKIGLASGIGVVTFQGKYGLTMFKGGHDDFTGNLLLSVVSKKSGVVLLSNSVRAECLYPAIINHIFGETGMPWIWEYNPVNALPVIGIDK